VRRTSPKEEALLCKASWIAVKRQRKVAHAFSSSFSRRRRRKQKEWQQQHKSTEANWIRTGIPRLENNTNQTVEEQLGKSQNSLIKVQMVEVASEYSEKEEAYYSLNG